MHEPWPVEWASDGCAPPHTCLCTARAMLTQTLGWRCTKLVVPSSGSTSHVGASVSASVEPCAAEPSSPARLCPSRHVTATPHTKHAPQSGPGMTATACHVFLRSHTAWRRSYTSRGAVAVNARQDRRPSCSPMNL